jgi:hypothetical protein
MCRLIFVFYDQYEWGNKRMCEFWNGMACRKYCKHNSITVHFLTPQTLKVVLHGLRTQKHWKSVYRILKASVQNTDFQHFALGHPVCTRSYGKWLEKFQTCGPVLTTSVFERIWNSLKVFFFEPDIIVGVRNNNKDSNVRQVTQLKNYLHQIQPYFLLID